MLLTADVTRVVLDLYLMQHFIIRWRVWLTDRLTGDWLDDKAYYRGRFLDGFGGQPVDNPDQRIQQDIDVFTTGTGPETNTPTVATSQTLLFGTVYSMVSVVAFAPILWNLAGPLTFFGVTVPKALFWIVLLYVAATTVVAFWIGKPIIRLTLPQRSDQRGLPLRVGADPRRRRGGRALPRRAHRARYVVRALRASHRELSQAGAPRRRVHRLEPDDEPDRLARCR